MKKTILILVHCLFFSLSIWGQKTKQKAFPEDWSGIWKGEMVNYDSAGVKMRFPMQLHILPTDSSHKWTWKIVYAMKDRPKDERSYQLIIKDKNKGYYAIDEKDGIVLDAFYLNGKLFSNFAIGDDEIMAIYYLEGDTLIDEMMATSTKSYHISGGIGVNVPFVSSFLVNGYFRAELKRVKK